VSEEYGGTAPKFCRFHRRGLLPLPPVEHTKLRNCTCVRGGRGGVTGGRVGEMRGGKGQCRVKRKRIKRAVTTVNSLITYSNHKFSITCHHGSMR